MKSNKCHNCGANIDLKTLTCPYCGSTYVQPTEVAKSSSFSVTLNGFLNDISKALKPLDEAIKPLYNEISNGIKNGVEKGKENTNQPTAKNSGKTD
ncbi:MAG: hydrogenase maturation nickel metallochaperone HypA [Christensenellaceae bacterium]|jgi:hypothetical protein|nr:hydrogenase maturation nickel metallochaperone HypA [Christensenellaceae bacterium]